MTGFPHWLGNNKVFLGIVFAAGVLWYQSHEANVALRDISQEIRSLREKVVLQSAQLEALTEQFARHEGQFARHEEMEQARLDRLDSDLREHAGRVRHSNP